MAIRNVGRAVGGASGRRSQSRRRTNPIDERNNRERVNPRETQGSRVEAPTQASTPQVEPPVRQTEAQRSASNIPRQSGSGSANARGELRTPQPRRGGQANAASGRTTSTSNKQPTGQTNSPAQPPDVDANTGKFSMSSAMDQAGSNIKGSIAAQIGGDAADVTGTHIAGAVAGHVGRGAVAGGAIGGSMEWAQGGSFWEGAKGGAMTGGMAWGGYRMARRAGGDKGVMQGGRDLMNAGRTQQGVSKPLTSLTKNAEASNLARQTMNK